jgi:RNA polymerase sigma factor (sigma-70 family)
MDSIYERDEDLWLKVKAGDRHSFEILYRRVFAMLFRFGGKIASSKLVKDAIHDMFLDIWHYRHSLQPTTSVRYYLFSSLKRRLVLNSKNSQRFSVVDRKADWVTGQPLESHEEIIIENERLEEKTQKLVKHLQELPPRQYEALLLKYFHKFSYDEIAIRLEVNEQSARNLVRRGLELLKKYSQITVTWCIYYFL